MSYEFTSNEMISAAKIFAANIGGFFYRVSDDSFVCSGPVALAVKCKVIRDDKHPKADDIGVIADSHYFSGKFDRPSINACVRIGKALVDKKYTGPLDRYINGLTGVAIKSPIESHGEAKSKKAKYHYLQKWKIGVPKKEFNEEDVPALDAALTILFGPIHIVINVSPENRVKPYFDNELKWCGTCYKQIEQFEIAHGLARKHHKDKSDTDPENLYRTCFDCNRTMIDEHILHYQHKLDTERKEIYYFNTPKARLGNRVMKDMYKIHKHLIELGIEDELDIYHDPLEVYKKLVIKEGMAVILKQCIPDDYVMISKKDAIQRTKSVKTVPKQDNSKCCIL